MLEEVVTHVQWSYPKVKDHWLSKRDMRRIQRGLGDESTMATFWPSRFPGLVIQFENEKVILFPNGGLLVAICRPDALLASGRAHRDAFVSLVRDSVGKDTGECWQSPTLTLMLVRYVWPLESAGGPNSRVRHEEAGIKYFWTREIRTVTLLLSSIAVRQHVDVDSGQIRGDDLSKRARRFRRRCCLHVTQ